MKRLEHIRSDQLFDIGWSVSTAGYKWVKGKTTKGSMLRGALVPPVEDWMLIEVKPQSERFRYPPLGDADVLGLRPAPTNRAFKLYEVFANTKETQNDILTFADQYGLLGEDVLMSGSGESVVGEPLWLWMSEIQAMKRAIELWDTYRRTQDTREELQTLVNKRLTNRLSPKLLWNESDKHLGLYLRPHSLIGALWLQLGNAIDRGCHWRRCRARACRVLFEVAKKRWSPTGGRGHRLYCSDACRMKDCRKRARRRKRR
jgi:hypothetical protein